MLRVLQQFILITLFAIFASQASAMFIQPDWFEVDDPAVGTNRYSYSHNDPVNLADPGGNVPYNPGGDTSTGWYDNDRGGEDYCSCTDRGSRDYTDGLAHDDRPYSVGTWHENYGRDEFGSRASIFDNVPGSIYNDEYARDYTFGASRSMGIHRPTNIELGIAIGGAAIGGSAASKAPGVLSRIFGRTTTAVPRSLSAAATPVTLQTGGRTLSNRTVKALNERFGTNLSKGDWGRALEDLKRDAGLRNDFHGKIFSDGSYGSSIDDVIGNISHYLP